MSLSTEDIAATSAFWRREYELKATHTDPIVQSGRGAKYNAIELLSEIRRATALLELDRTHTVLDVGCANGLFGLVISACCKRYIGVEPVEALAERSRFNLTGLDNAEVMTASGDDIALPADSVDRVLIAEVIQLNPPTATRCILEETARILRKHGRIVLLSVPDQRERAAFESGYTEQIKRADHLTGEQKQAILDRQANAHWYLASELIEWATELGGSARVANLPPNAPNCDHRFDLVIDF